MRVGSGFTTREARKRKLINIKFGVKMSVINALLTWGGRRFSYNLLLCVNDREKRLVL